MALLTTQAIVLRSFPYNDGRLIVDMLCRQGGRLSFAVSVPRNATGRSRLRRQLFQPLTMVEAECDVRPNADLHRIRELRLSYAYTTLPFDEARLAQGLFVAEFLLYATRGERQGESLYDYVSASLEWLDRSPRRAVGTTGSRTANFHLVFMMRLSRLLGFYPNLQQNEGERWFDLRGGCFCDAPPAHHDYLAPEEADHLRLLMRMDFSTMHLFRLSRQQRNRCVEIIESYYRLHLPQFPELRSLDVLQSLW